MARVHVSGIDYSPEGIEDVRQELIIVRGEAMKQLPDAAGFIVLVTHVIAMLADYAEMRTEEEKPDTCSCSLHCHNVPGYPQDKIGYPQDGPLDPDKY